MSTSRLFKCFKNCVTYAGLGAFVGATLPTSLTILTPILDPLLEFESSVMLLLNCFPEDDVEDLNPFLFLSKLSAVALFGLTCFAYQASTKAFTSFNFTASDWIVLGGILGGTMGILKPIKQKNFFSETPSTNISFEKRLQDINFPMDNIPQRFLCPISLTLMDDPIIARDGHTYDRVSFVNAVLSCRMVSPLEHTPLTDQITIPNKDLRSEILEFVEKAERKHKAQQLHLKNN